MDATVRARALTLALHSILAAILVAAPEAPAHELPAVYVGDAPGLYSESGWRRVAIHPDGTRVAKKRIAGMSVPAVRVTMEVDVDSDAYLSVLTDRRQFAKVASAMYVEDTAILARGGAGESPYEDVYTVLRFPSYLPVKDRDQVLRIWNLRNADAPGHHRMAWVAVPARQYAAKLSARRAGQDVIYMERSTGCWEMRPLPGGRTEVTYRGLAHPGGDFPEFLVARTQEEQMPALMRALAAEAHRRAGRLTAAGSPQG